MAKYPWGIMDCRTFKVVRWCYTKKEQERLLKEWNKEPGAKFLPVYN